MNSRRFMGAPSSGLGRDITTPLRKNAAVHHSKNCAMMSQMGLGCAKTPALAPHVEISLSNCIFESQIILHTRGSMPCWRIVFSTFRGCMSFYTARVKLGHPGDVRLHDHSSPESGSPFAILLCRKSARTGCEQSQQSSLYSITSSARTSNDGGTSSPSDFAVLRLRTVSYLVGACTGRSVG
jgi:hypothetical protein